MSMTREERVKRLKGELDGWAENTGGYELDVAEWAIETLVAAEIIRDNPEVVAEGTFRLGDVAAVDQLHALYQQWRAVGLNVAPVEEPS